jgi:hypothetical protein
MTVLEPGSRELKPRHCEHCGGSDPAAGGVMVTKRVVTVVYEQHGADCPTLSELAR